MPHIVLLDEWQEQLSLLHDYSEQVGDALANGEYDSDPKRKSDAEALMANTTTFIGDVNTAYRNDLDGYVSNFEDFLGI